MCRLTGASPRRRAAGGAPGAARWTGQLGLKRSHLADGARVPLTALPAPANTRDHLLLPATLDVLTGLLEQVGADPHETTVHLDAGYDYRPAGPSWLTEACTQVSPGLYHSDSLAHL